MRKSLIITLIIFILFSFKSNPYPNSQRIENLKTFAKVYGFIKYFHPSDEASEINWNKFASYGASQVWPCTSREELIQKLQDIFEPIAPSIKFSTEKLNLYDISKLSPPGSDNYDLTYWQHRGVGLGMKTYSQSPYKSVRVNGLVEKETPKNYGILTNIIKVNDYKDKKIRFTISAKLKEPSNTSAYIRLALVNTDGSTILKKETIGTSEWNSYLIETEIKEVTEVIEIGAALKGDSSLFLDDAELAFWNGDNWEIIPLDNADFEQDTIIEVPEVNQWSHRGDGYVSEITKEESYHGQSAAKLFQNLDSQPMFGKKLFETAPEFGEVINEEIGQSIFCQVPLVLYSNTQGTYPKSNSLKLKNLLKDMSEMTYTSNLLDLSLGNIINTYNVFQHFYPYMDAVEVDWDKELSIALSRCFIDKSRDEHYITLEKFTAPLKDGHINVQYSGIHEIYAPSITWEWIENKLVITAVLNNKIPLKIGDVVTHVDGISSRDYFQEIYSRISASNKGWLEFRGKRKSLLGEFEEIMTIRVDEKEIGLNRSSVAYNEGPRQSTYEKLNDESYYINISRIEMDQITKLLPDLAKAKAIICDLRGYPNKNHMFLSHLLKERDTSNSWMQIPEIIYPNQKNIAHFEKYSWNLPTKKPYLGDKQVIFITDGSAISYAESYMGFIEGYDLATIIGQPTAGTNGNTNSFELEGGFSITWTGMKVLKHDGSQHHGIGITPDIYLEKTIKGIREGKDEFLEKAIELIN
ncbi:Peptidase family S41 [Arenibacter palladensis]|uniref:Peptidase family S41 n=1 Tax=Arenibacter palladensis TaxID=237373 RepID=A0A1M5DU08_9FLAO|nr:S41 family peptidase [Arenibacter palladensis]SHF70415.1 Peptidase family S41 [Arenibacter palladensis]